ncbi:MAG TPA: hypothetical protein VLG92_03485 [Candidatus Saccharimonadia bacterium]|nr:hypothetical protein [Candidatus Saccharimonadia bacterium]
MDIKQAFHDYYLDDGLEYLTRNRLRDCPQVLGRIACILYMDRCNRKQARSLSLRLINRRAATKIRECGTPPIEQPNYQEIGAVYTSVWRWHGTGRYQVRNGNIVDVLEGMVAESGLRPHLDAMDLKTGKGEFVSTSRARMYARPYADMHRNPKDVAYRYGTPSFWGKYFMASVPFHTFFESNLWRKSNWDNYRKTALPIAVQWRDKVKLNPVRCDMYDALDSGSDIPGNYPILIGFKSNAFEEVDTSKAIGRCESRSQLPIPLTNVTHIEVPLQYAEETARILSSTEMDIPIIPLEYGELYCSQLPFSDLVSNNPLPSL